MYYLFAIWLTYYNTYAFDARAITVNQNELIFFFFFETYATKLNESKNYIIFL